MDQLRAKAASYISIEENTDARRKTMKAPAMTTFTSYKRKRSEKFEKYTP